MDFWNVFFGIAVSFCVSCNSTVFKVPSSFHSFARGNSRFSSSGFGSLDVSVGFFGVIANAVVLSNICECCCDANQEHKGVFSQ